MRPSSIDHSAWLWNSRSWEFWRSYAVIKAGVETISPVTLIAARTLIAGTLPLRLRNRRGYSHVARAGCALVASIALAAAAAF